ncbi:argininosuccinate synthase domain-containing protein [Umezawaea sp.]|uniref:argininosuccinate synthase domain-containing protein n=1 Tax=Umezawaea sp. TaxID=1955258 RepID=UPI002ED3B631
MTERVVLAYSGGLDSSVALGRLAERTGAEVVAVAVDLGQGGEDPAVLRRRALACGAVDAVVVDARDEFATDYCLPAVRANALRRGERPLASAVSRPVVVKHLAEAAERHGATAVAHGSARAEWFEIGIGALAPDLEVLAPLRYSSWTREEAIRWVEERALPIDVTRTSPYSADRTAWGRVVGLSQRRGAEWYDPDEVVVTFDRGVPVALDGETVTALQAVRELNRRARDHGVGRLVDADGRECCEAPGAVALITAHRALEAVTLDRDTARFKRDAERRWGELVHDGLWFSPLKNALDAFIETTQDHVSGEVRVRLHGGRAAVDGPRGDAASGTDRRGDTFDEFPDLPSKRDLNK